MIYGERARFARDLHTLNSKSNMEITHTNAMCINISATSRHNHELGSVRVIFEKSRKGFACRGTAEMEQFPFVIFRTMENPLSFYRWEENPVFPIRRYRQNLVEF